MEAKAEALFAGVHAQQTVDKRCWIKCMLAQSVCSGLIMGNPAKCCAAPGKRPHL